MPKKAPAPSKAKRSAEASAKSPKNGKRNGSAGHSAEAERNMRKVVARKTTAPASDKRRKSEWDALDEADRIFEAEELRRAQASGIRNRILRTELIPAGELASRIVPHPDNPKTHTEAGREGLRGSLREVGVCDVLLTREGEDGRLHMFDGHERLDEIPLMDPAVPVMVVVTDLSAEEADKQIIVHDYLSELAEKNGANIRAILDRVRVADDSMRGVMEALSLQVFKELPGILRGAGGGLNGDGAPGSSEGTGAGLPGTGDAASSGGHVKVVYLFLNEATFAEFTALVQNFATSWASAGGATENTTDTVMRIVREAHSATFGARA